MCFFQHIYIIRISCVFRNATYIFFGDRACTVSTCFRLMFAIVGCRANDGFSRVSQYEFFADRATAGRPYMFSIDVRIRLLCELRVFLCVSQCKIYLFADRANYKGAIWLDRVVAQRLCAHIGYRFTDAFA